MVKARRRRRWTSFGNRNGLRFFALDPAGKILYAANENSNGIVEFRLDEARGQLTPSGLPLQTGSPG
ncbi:beta-propeller fold lactonase family protein [Ralstonia pseudosolanacearum]|uniref:beta-propeller fold lactonase family protein n=1 Tax=Ralstonia pseudosolanacearum TaxID=1310165 RepID=UPI0018D1395D|nr:beta-propeller fold lactonase family protein [Ralstonia pseudosolanacearum]